LPHHIKRQRFALVMAGIIYLFSG